MAFWSVRKKPVKKQKKHLTLTIISISLVVYIKGYDVKLSVKSEYACLALIELASLYNKDIRRTIAEIAEIKGIPKKYLEQILLSLKRAGYVKSYKGSKGGYKLAKAPSKINVAEIIRLMDGALAPVESVSSYFYEQTPIEKSPKLLDVLRNIRNYISDTLEHVSFEDLIE